MCSAVARRAAHGYGNGRAVQLLLLAAVLTLLATGCRRVDPVVKVGLVAPFEGRHRAVGYDVLYSARLAVREVNAAGGIGGTRIALVALDDSGSPEFAEATAESLVVDPAVVAVVGHWLPDTTNAAQPIYTGGDLVFLAGGEEMVDPQELSPEFIAAYTAVTPFDETPGPYAGPAYEAYQSLWRLLEEAHNRYGSITRENVLKISSDAE